jgi:predicted nucleic acid-binding protein
MSKHKIYLDNCVYNRPFDDKEQLTVRMEAEAKLKIQEDIRNGLHELVWSYMNEYENNDNPYEDKKESIQIWEHIAQYVYPPNERVLERGTKIQHNNIRPKDSLNLACAIESECQYFITTDIPLLKKAVLFTEIKIINPIDFIRAMEEENGSGN